MRFWGIKMKKMVTANLSVGGFFKIVKKYCWQYLPTGRQVLQSKDCGQIHLQIIKNQVYQ